MVGGGRRWRPLLRCSQAWRFRSYRGARADHQVHSAHFERGLVVMNWFHYGVVVGINRYPDIRHLQRARGDAEKFAEWLNDPGGGGVPVENVVKVIVEDERVPPSAL